MHFFGRQHEIAALTRWVESEPRDDFGRAGLLIGSAGIGKSALLRRLAELCRDHPQRWVVQHETLNRNEEPGPFFERLLSDAHQLVRNKPLRTGPNDRRYLKELLGAVPAAGTLLAALVADVQRPPWRRFVDYAQALSDALAQSDARYLLLIDPDWAMSDAQAHEWLSVANALPPRVRLLIAQRPDDAIAAHPESRRRFVRPLADGLGDLTEPQVAEWYETELAQGLLEEPARRSAWDTETRRSLPHAAFQHYRGHPLALDAVIKLLAADMPPDPLDRIRHWPPTLAGLMDSLFDRLASDPKRLGAALMLQVFGVPAPRDVWARAAGLSPDELASALADPRFRAFFLSQTREDGEVFAPYHALFAERLERHLASEPAETALRAERAWGQIERALEAEKLNTSRPRDFELLAAVPVVLRLGSPKRLIEVVNRVWSVKWRLGLLGAAEADLRWAGAAFERDEAVQAPVYGNLGLIYRTRGDLDEAERMHRKSLAIEEKLGRQEGMASDYGNLGLIYRTRGDLDEAERMLRRALEINEKLGRLEGMANQYGNLGLIYETRGDLDEAERMLRKALAIEEKLGRQEDMAAQYGNLGLIYQTRGDLDEAERMHRKSLAIEEKLGRLEGMANQYGNLGLIYQTRGDLDQAERMLRKALEINEKLGRLEGMAAQYGNLGGIYRTRGDAAQARRLWTQARELFARVGMPHRVALMDEWLATLPPQAES